MGCNGECYYKCIDIIIESKYVYPWKKEMICISGALVLIVAKSDLANCGLVHGTMAAVYLCF